MPASLENLDCESLSSTLSSPPSPGSPLSPSHSLHRLDRKSSVRPYHSKDAYLYAMREDLAVWFNDLYNTTLTADNLLENLQDGTFLCLHANNVKSYIEASSNSSPTHIPDILYRTGIKPGSFQARDNLANFIAWVRKHLGVNDVLLFESDDLVLLKNEKNVILCLLEVARRGARYGMLAPMLVQFEQEIDAMEQKLKRAEGRRNSQGSQGSVNNDTTAANSDTDSDKASLDEWVQSVVRRCTCPKQFPLIHVSRGKYRIGYTQNTVFVRILRNHVMIRVGGGWDTLEHYLDKHDPCRCHRPSTGGGSLRRTRQRTSTAKDPKRDKSPMISRTRSQSVTSLESPTEPSSPFKSTRSGSSDMLSSNLLITRDESGKHMVDDQLKSSTPKSPSKKYLTPSKNTQRVAKSRQNSLSVSPNRDKLARSSSPSHDLVRKWKHTFNAQSSRAPIKENTEGNTKNFRNSSASRVSDKPRSHSRTRTCSPVPRPYSRTRTCSPAPRGPRSRSYTRAATPSPHRQCSERKASLCATPRKDKRHSDSIQPTRIPGPVTNSGMISSTSTCNSSMDSLMTI